MAPRKAPETKGSSSPVKRRRTVTCLDRDHEFLLRCLIESNCRINFAAVAESHGYTEGSARNRFTHLKTQFMSQNDATHTKANKKHEEQQIKNEDADHHADAIHTGDTETTEDVEKQKIKQEDEDDGDLAPESD